MHSLVLTVNPQCIANWQRYTFGVMMQYAPVHGRKSTNLLRPANITSNTRWVRTDPDKPQQPLTDDARRRILSEMDARKVTKRDISRKILLGEGSVGLILSGKQGPSLANFLAIIGELGLHPSWVILGEGAKYTGEPSAPQKSESSVEHKQITTGVDSWIADTHEVLTKDEKDWLRYGVKWTQPDVRQPDDIYERALAVYRDSKRLANGSASGKPSRTIG